MTLGVTLFLIAAIDDHPGVHRRLGDGGDLFQGAEPVIGDGLAGFDLYGQGLAVRLDQLVWVA